jgi:hypothetical protein
VRPLGRKVSYGRCASCCCREKSRPRSFGGTTNPALWATVEASRTAATTTEPANTAFLRSHVAAITAATEATGLGCAPRPSRRCPAHRLRRGSISILPGEHHGAQRLGGAGDRFGRGVLRLHRAQPLWATPLSATGASAYPRPRSTTSLLRPYPLFPCYLLLPIADAKHSAIHVCRGVRKVKPILCDADGYLWRAPDRVIAAVREAEDGGAFDKVLRQGDAVQVARDVLAGVQAVVDQHCDQWSG